MTRIYVVVEGQSEESFVNDVVGPTLWPQQKFVMPVLLGPPGHKGGNPKYARVRKDIVKQLKQDRSSYCSMMFDLFRLGADFPGLPLPANTQTVQKALRIEEAVKADIVQHVPDLRADTRFIPYIQLHEYEGLLFSDPHSFATGIAQPHLEAQFQMIRKQFPTPEDINDGPNTAPSKRILAIYSQYRKAVDGTLAAKAVGLPTIRQECPHFRSWLEQLEGVA